MATVLEKVFRVTFSTDFGSSGVRGRFYGSRSEVNLAHPWAEAAVSHAEVGLGPAPARRCPQPSRLGGFSRSFRVGLSAFFCATLVGVGLPADGAPVSIRVAPGWNLVAMPLDEDGTVFQSWKSRGLSLWGAHASGVAATDGLVELVSFTGEGGIWVYAEQSLELPFPGAAHSGPIDSGWNFIQVAEDAHHADTTIDHLYRWDAKAQRYTPVPLGETLRQGFGYWGHVGRLGAPLERLAQATDAGRETSWAPSRLMAAPSGMAALLAWTEPSGFGGDSTASEGGRQYRVYRDGAVVAEVDRPQHEDAVPKKERAYRYYVTAVVKDASGNALESPPSNVVVLDFQTVAPAAAPGDFEAPSVLGRVEGQVGPQKVALSARGEGARAHSVYVVKKGEAGGAELFYRRSEKAAKEDSFDAPQTLVALTRDWMITGLQVAARGQKAIVVWVQENEASGQQELWISKSESAGAHFSEPALVRGNQAWKRGIDVGYDRFGQVHLVWGEASKVYYLKGLEGEPENVFDAQVRDRNEIVVDYLHFYEEGCNTPSPCGCGFSRERYSYALEINPETGQPFGPYLYRTEEAWVYDPALEIDHEKVSIVAWQDRMWDNRPVPNPDWRGDYASVVPPAPNECYLDGTRRYQEGFMQVWQPRSGAKHAPPMDLDVTRSRAWYFYAHDGTWHEQDQIRVAQRPLVAGAWAAPKKARVEIPTWPIERGLLTWSEREQSVEGGWRQGLWKDGRLQNWRFSVVLDADRGLNGGGTSNPALVSTPSGALVVAYERWSGAEPEPHDDHRGSSDRHIVVRGSDDGGLHWSDPIPVGYGYAPDLSVTADGEVGVAFYAADRGALPAEVQIARSRDLQTWVSTSVSAPSLRATAGDMSFASNDPLGTPALAAEGDLFVVTWTGEDKVRGGVPGERILTSRASRVAEAQRYDISHEDKVAVGESIRFTVTAVNEYDMRVNVQGGVRVETTTGSGHGGSAASGRTDSGHFQSGTGHRGGAAFQSVVQLEHGQATLYSVVDDTESTITVRGVDEGGGIEAVSMSVEAYPSGAKGNYLRAVDARNTLLRTVVDEATHRTWTYQVEYAPKQEGLNGGIPVERFGSDSEYLAGFERVWVYTQGIALAQLSKQNDIESMGWAQGLARFLCDHARRGSFEGEEIIRGWPFSWNTKNDTWKDVRLVTGANAWAIHGLGTFIVSEAFRRLEGWEQAQLRTCYHQAIRGLEEHRRAVIDPKTGHTVTLMTAGWTALGLQHASHPASIRRPGSEAGQAPFEEDAGGEWAYYSVLDALGYETFNALRPPEIKRLPSPDAAVSATGPRVLSERDLALLKTPVQAQNVVTEHNLDVLSVLNHAIAHSEDTGLTGVQGLKSWRDALRAAIFSVLWDEAGWRDGLRRARDDAGIDAEHRARIDAALDENSLGRVITGGELVGGAAPYGFAPSVHVAIDNCSWLSLSVDYHALRAHPEYVRRLGQCLEYTELHFAKNLTFESRTYYGTHYFQNAFRDPYIAPSALQASSYHLEATTGLILGLERFARAQPDHPRSALFGQKVNALWDGVQSFVTDFGFPYSSQRIQDLSTLLSSSTAAIWFIDVYEALDGGEPPQTPLKSYAAYLLSPNEVDLSSLRSEAPMMRWVNSQPNTALALRSARALAPLWRRFFTYVSRNAPWTGSLAVAHAEEDEGGLAPQGSLIPDWIKNNAEWWATGQIDEDTFIQGIQFLVDEGIITVSGERPEGQGTSTETIPDWVKKNAGWWADGAIDDRTFLNGIEFLANQGIIQVDQPAGETLLTAEPIPWSPCEVVDGLGGGLECGVVEVPLDYDDREKGTIPIAVARRPANDAKPLGVLLLLPGGPGDSGIETLRVLTLAQITGIPPSMMRRFDIVSFDRRGVGESAPVACDSNEEFWRSFDYDFDDGFVWNVVAGNFVVSQEQCLAGDSASRLMPYLGSKNVARDMEQIRLALDVNEMSILAYSRGSLDALLYAEDHARRIRALVLDGPMDPGVSLLDVHGEQARAVYRLLEQFFERCEGTPGCTMEALTELISELKKGPVTTGGPFFERKLTLAELLHALEVAVNAGPMGSWAEGQPVGWWGLETAFEKLHNDDVGGFLDLFQTYSQDPTASDRLGWRWEQNIWCLDQKGRPTVDDVASLMGDLQAHVPPFSDLVFLALHCANFPLKPDPIPLELPASGAPKAIVVGGSMDGRIPLEWPERVAASLDSAVFLRSEHVGHTTVFLSPEFFSYQASSCTNQIVENYLLDPTDLPEPGQVCQPELSARGATLEHRHGDGAPTLTLDAGGGHGIQPVPLVWSKCILGDGPFSDPCSQVGLDDSTVMTGWRQSAIAAAKRDPAVKTWLAWLGLGGSAAGSVAGSVIAEQLQSGVSMQEAHESYCRDPSITQPVVTHGFLWGCMDRSKPSSGDPWSWEGRMGNGSPGHPFRDPEETGNWLRFFSAGDSVEVAGLFGLPNLSKLPAIILEPGGTELDIRPRFELEGPFDCFLLSAERDSGSANVRAQGPGMNVLPFEHGKAVVFFARDLQPEETFVTLCSHDPTMFNFDPTDRKKLEKVLDEHKHDIFIARLAPEARHWVLHGFRSIDEVPSVPDPKHPTWSDQLMSVSDGAVPGLPMVCVTLSSTQPGLDRLLRENRLNEIRYDLLSSFSPPAPIPFTTTDLSVTAVLEGDRLSIELSPPAHSGVTREGAPVSDNLTVLDWRLYKRRKGKKVPREVWSNALPHFFEFGGPTPNSPLRFETKGRSDDLSSRWKPWKDFLADIKKEDELYLALTLVYGIASGNNDQTDTAKILAKHVPVKINKGF